MKGTELLEWMKNNRPSTIRVMFTGNPCGSVAQEAINKGEVFRFLGKPWEDTEVKDVIKESLAQHRLVLHFNGEAESLKNRENACRLMKIHVERTIQQLTTHFDKLKTHKTAVLTSLAETVEARDPYTHGHQARVTEIASALARKLGLTNSERETLKMACMLHDIGKVGIPDEIVFCTGSLSPEMWKKMKLHPEIGGKILDPINYEWKIKDIVVQHHERFDGLGYPMGLKGNQIVLGARILGVADAFDAMSSDRPYRKALSTLAIIRELERDKGKQFSPLIAQIMIDIVKEGTLVKKLYNNLIV
jgi:putative nucleotidyltransferase with HDIG domain